MNSYSPVNWNMHSCNERILKLLCRVQQLENLPKNKKKRQNLSQFYIFIEINENNFIIIIDMSSGLISSLFRDHSFATRSSSLFNKSILPRQNNQERARSHSTYMDKNPNSNSSNPYLPVARMVHTLAVKIKKLNYFLFCRLQANLKKWKADNSQTDKKINNQIIPVSVIPVSKQKLSGIDKLEKQEKFRKGFESLAQFFQLCSLKHQSYIKTEQSFTKLKKYNKKKQSSIKLSSIICLNKKRKLDESFKKLQSYQKFLLRSEIFSEASVHILQPKIKSIFKNIYDFSISKPKKVEAPQTPLTPSKLQERSAKKQNSKQLMKQKQKEGQKNQNLLLNISQHIGFLNQRLKSIEQQNSLILSEEETARYVTPEKNQFQKQKKISIIDDQRQKTSRKQPRNSSYISRKQTKKQYEQFQQQNFPSVSKSSHKNNQQVQDRFKLSAQKMSTKKQPHRPKISMPRAYKIQTSLSDNKKIKLKDLSEKCEQNQFMAKHNRLYSESIPNMLPDLHDNMGVFQESWKQQINNFAEDFILSHRTVQKQKKNFIQIQNNKTVGHYIQNVENVDVLQEDLQRISFKENAQKRRSTVSSRAMTNSISSPKFGIQGSGVDSSGVKSIQNTRQLRSGTSSANQFYSSPLYKIQQMMIDLERLREKEKFGCKYTSGYQKCKISVNLPSKKYEGRSYQCSANRTSNNSSCKNIVQQCKSEKKQVRQVRRQFQKRGSYKQNREHKENIQVKLWDEKQKFLFYTQAKNKQKLKERKKSSGLISSANQTQINTARKMKKQIENIINRRNRTSLGSLRLLKAKY